MRSPPGGRDRKLSALSGHGVAQARDQISGQKRTVSRSAQDPLRIGPVGGGPVEPGQDSGERTWIMLYPIGNDGESKRRKAQGIAIGAESQAFALRREPRNDAGQNRAAANLAQRLVAATHSPRQTAGEDHARHAGSFSHRSGVLACGKRTCKAPVKHVPFLERHDQSGIPRLNDGSASIACRLAEYKEQPTTKREKPRLTGRQRSAHVEP